MLNHITIMGRLTRDPELRRTGSGLAVASFSVAVERDYPNKDTGEREVDFIDCVAWRQTGEFVSKWFAKGQMIVVSGRLQIRKWTDKDGNKRNTAEIIVDNAYFGESKKDRESSNTGSGANGINPAYSVPNNYATYNPVNPYSFAGGYAIPGNEFSMMDDDDGAVLPF